MNGTIIKDMNLTEAKRELKRLENKLAYWQEERRIAIDNATGIKAVNFDKVIVTGGKPADSNATIDRVIDEIDPIIKTLKQQIRNLMSYIENEMKIIGEYKPIEAKIILLREEKKLKWRDIAKYVNYSERQCRRMYDKYKQSIKRPNI